ncbi:hypothetical protein ACIBI9_03705 [Nonomuraea sp. NPDC050451]|uniref:hypothetical protein n=1 Tax=Nonomuraea sp. NPDC050451 TaxID=3364364 RepID=UPI0037A9B544
MSGLAALLGFLLGVFVGYGAAEPSEEPAPRVTVTVEDTQPPESEPTGTGPSSPVQPTQPTQPTQPQGTQPPASQPGATQPGPGQTAPGQTAPGQTAPGQTAPGQTGQPSAGTGSSPAFNSVSMRTLVVGTDIQPGTYRTAGPTAGIPMCYWARLRSATGDEIASGMPAGPASVTILATDKAFRTAGCAEWIRA